jgi:formylglycine-generating enzyme required for sulfatase activity
VQPETDEKHLWLLLRKQNDNSTFVERLSLDDGRVVETRELPGYSTNVARLTPDGSTIATQSIHGEIRIWDVETWSDGLRFWRPMVSELAISPDRSLVAFGYPSGELEICDIVKRKVVLHLHEHVRSITSLQFSQDGQELCTSSLDFTTRKWKLSELLAWVENRSAGDNTLRVEFTNSLQMQFSPIPQGDFLMGMREGLRTSRFFHPVFELEAPRHEVRITRPFYLARHEVTVGQFREFVNATGYITDVEKSKEGGSHVPFGKYVYERSPLWTWHTPPFEQTDDHPVVLVSWHDAQAFCKWLSEKEGRVYRLPTEAEWEYACRAGTTTSWYTGNTFASLEGHVNTADMLYAEAYHTRLDGKLPDDGYVFTAPVGSYRSNGFGLFDMSGNVYEWCQDFNDRKRYEKNPRVDPTGPKNGKARVIRGGSFVVPAMHARSAKRDDFSHMPDEGWSTTGFRVLMEIKDNETLPDSIIPDAD